MEYFFRHNQRRLIPIKSFSLIFFLGVFFISQLSAAEPQANASPANDSSTSLDFANGLYVRKMYAPAISEYEKFIQSNPGSSEASSAHFRLADSYFFSKNYPEAIDKFQAFIKNFPNDNRVSIAWFRVATAHYYLKQTAPAVKIFQKIAKDATDPTIRGGALFYMGKSYEGKKNSEKSVEIYQKLLKEYPQNEFATYASIELGDYYLKEKKFDSAVTAYQIAADRNMPAEIARDARFKIAEVHFYNKEYTKAKDDYEKLLALHPAESEETTDAQKKINATHEKALMNLFYCDYQLHDLDTAKKRLDAEKDFIQKTGHMSEVKFLITSIVLDKKDYAAASSGFDELIADPQTDKATKEKAIFKKAKTLALSGKKEEAFQVIQDLLTQDPTNPAMVYYEKGELLKDIGDYSGAAAAFEAVPQKNSGDYYKAALYELGDVYAKAGDPVKARQSLEQAVALFREDEQVPKAYFQMIQLDLDAGNFAKAVETALLLIKEHSQDPLLDIAYYKLGVALTGLQKYKQAADAFQYVIHHYPMSKVYAESLYGKAASIENQGDTKHAAFLYEKFCHDYPDSPLAAEAVSRLGFIYIQANDFERARKFYEDLIFNKPNVKVDTDGVFWLMQYLLDHSDYAKLSKILELLPNRIPGQDLSHEIAFFQGESAMGMKDYVKAIDFYAQSIKIKSNGAYVPHANLGLGIASAVMNKDADAEKYFAEALRYDSEVKVTMRARFEIANLRLKAGNIPEAAKAFMMVAILYDDEKYTPLALYKAGECFTQLNKFDDAHKAFSELKAHYPKSEWAEKIPDKENY